MSNDATGTERIVRPATRADVSELAGVLARAFFDEGTFVWLQPDDELRARLLPVMFRSTLRYVHPVDQGSEVLADKGALSGGAVWRPPGRWKAPMWQQLRGIPELIGTLGLKNLRGYATRGKAIEDALHKVHPSQPHWYLAAVGVDPEAQEKGVGSALVRSGLDRCDREGADAYLECVEDLVPYYEVFGFEATGPIEMPEGAPPQVSMWRAQS